MTDHRRSLGSGRTHETVAGTGRDDMSYVYGRRIEADRSWTVYHVFTGVPVEIGGHTMVGLGQAAATESMLAMNLRNSSRHARRIRLDAPRLDIDTVGTLGWH